MKIRILENSVRLRLTQSEVQTLSKEGSVRQSINFGNTVLYYAIHKTETSSIKGVYQADEILISVPDSVVDNWANSNQISLHESIKLNNNNTLKILIEKDFKCLTVREGEDESDMFPNPEEESLNC